jgi:hypothetical protein
MAWLGAMGIHSRDYDATTHASLAALTDMYTSLHLIINHFDADGDHGQLTSRAHPRISHTWISDMKVCHVPINVPRAHLRIR